MTLAARLRVERGAFVLDVDLHAPGGQVLAVLGPNGAGKSTLLRALAGLLPLTAGRVVLDDVVLDDVAAGVHRPPAARGVGVVFQDYRLFPHLSARENVAFGLRAAGVPRADARAQADGWLERLDLADLAGRRPGELSGGQAQRVAVARALAPSPGLLLLDEPLAALDAGTRAQVRGELRRQLDGFPGPCLLVTHDPMDALTLAGRLLVLEAGRVVQDGPPALVARRPKTRYVSQLVGLNLFRGRASGGVLTTAGGARVVVPDAVSGEALATVRPSAVTLHPGEPPASSARNRWPGRVQSVEALGDRARVAVAGTGGAPDVLADVTAQTVAELRLAPGDTVWATVKATDVDVYPAEPGP